MEFLYKSHLQTTTQLVVGSNTLLAQNVMTRDQTRQYMSNGFNNDATTASMTINFDTTVTVSRIILDGMNLKGFRLFYNGLTANAFALTSTAATTTSAFTNNTETGMVLSCTPVSVTSITIDMQTTQSANAEKALGYFYVGNLLLDFEKVPAANQYTPLVDSEEVVHKMSDGGVKINIKDRKRRTDVKLKYITQTFRDDLKEVYELEDEFVFVAFPTTTGWDKAGFPCVWEGDFNFFKYSDNTPNAGFDGTIRLRETPT